MRFLDHVQIAAKEAEFNRGLLGWTYRYLRPKEDPFVDGFHDTKSIFIHVPKAAGSSVAEAFFGQNVGHRPIRRHLVCKPVCAREYFKFTFVRNPWSRLHSAYHYFRRRVGTVWHRDHRWATEVLSDIDSFEAFVTELGASPRYARRIKRYDHFRDQLEWICEPSTGKICMDYVGRFECLETDFNYIASRINRPAMLSHQRRGGGEDYRDSYSSEMIEIVRSLYARDIENLGYDFFS